MTSFYTDRFLYNGELWRLLMVSQDATGQLLPADFSFKIHYFATDSCPGYMMTYTINDHRLMIHEIDFQRGARIDLQSSTSKPSADPSDLPQTIGTLANWNSEHRWNVFANLPPIHGVLPTVKFYQQGKVEHVEYGRYENLNLALDYSGGLLIAKDGGHRGFPTPHNYRHVIELCLENGKLVEALDQSMLVQDIIRDIDNPYQAISRALRHQHPHNLHFHHRYHVLF